VLVRTWNLFHGNTVPPQRRAFLDEMIELASADDPDVLCLQEVPAWALGRFTAGDVAARPKLGSRELGRLITDLDHGLLRSAVTGQGNAMQVSPRLTVIGHERLTLNPRRFRDRVAGELGLSWRLRLAWAKERRIVQALRLRAADGRTFLVANAHCTSHAAEIRIAEAELRRAAWFASSTAKAGDVVVLAGDFNLRPSSEALRELTSPEWGFSAPGPGIDHVLVRGAEAAVAAVWPDERRWRDGRLLSDHAPVEVEIT
jgi:endonuclease/exonuclease/phosphatase family metal-dependent hydrolase